jgi:hypothetical protein
MEDLIFYIHGVTPQENPGPHHAIYQRFHDGVKSFSPDWPAQFHGAEWGWNPGIDTPKDQELLSQAQRQLGNRILPAVDQARDFSINPGRLALNQLREINFYGFSDMFYYTSEMGKESVRGNICRQFLYFLDQEGLSQDQAKRVTLIGHSAGAVIAFDLLFHLFHPDHPPYSNHCFVDHDAKAESLKLREFAQSGQLQLRRLYTMGNPLTAMALRHNRVVEAFAAGEKLNPEHYGFVPAVELPGPRWLNLWDLDDALSWPVEGLMDTDSGMIKDVYVNVSSWITRAHNAYWNSGTAHKAVAEHW